MAEVITPDINNDKNSVIGLRHLDDIKMYVDGRLGEVSSELTTEIEQDLSDYLNKRLDDAKDQIKNDFETDLKDLQQQLEDAIINGDEQAIRDLEMKIDVLKEDLNTKDEALNAIRGELDILDGKNEDLKNSIFTKGEIDELIKTAFIDGTYITNDSVTTPNVFTTKLVALIGKFGKIKAANIEAGDIIGHTIASSEITEEGIPNWKIGNTGEGHLAKGNISWDAEGNVKIKGDGVLKWDSVDQTDNPVLNRLNELENAQNELKNSLSDGIGDIVDNWISDEMLSPAEIKSLKAEYAKLNGDYEVMTKYLDDIIAIYLIAKNDDMDKDIKQKYYDDLVNAKKDLTDIYNKAKSVCEYYINATTNSVGSVKIVPEQDLKSINEYYVVQDKVLVLYYDANSFYVTFNRFGSKLTYIGEDGIYSGTITGDQIKGWRISGLTMESSKTTELPNYVTWYKYNHEATNEEDVFDTEKGGKGPTWQISKDGDGHLANGQISWHGNTVILGPDVEITWASVVDGDEEVDKKLKTVNDNIDKIKDEINKFNKELLNIATDVGNITGDSSGGGNWPTPDMGEIETALENLQGQVTYISENAIYSENIIGQNIVGKSIVGVNLFAGKGEEVNGQNPAAFGVYGNGNGFLADGALKWYKENGKWRVILGEGVTIDWSSGVNKPDGSGGSGDGSGVGKFKSIIFCRTDITPKAPTGGTWYYPSDVYGEDENGNTVNWEDGVPSGTATLWSSTRLFATDDSGDDQWSTPTVMTDSPDFEVIYSKEEEYTAPSNDFYRDDDGEIKGWLDSNPTWSDDADEKTIWMATNEKNGGEWKGWKISKIKGEKGTDGTSITTKGPLESTDDLLTITNPTIGDAYVIDGELWVYTGADTEADINGFSNCGSFKGDPGDSLYIHEKYAKEVTFNDDNTVNDVELTDLDGESTVDAKWYGYIITSDTDDPTDWTLYHWSLINVDKTITTKLGAYNVFSNHISGKTIDNAVSSNVSLPKGLQYELFEHGDNGYDTENYMMVEVGKDTDYSGNVVTTGPAWQIRNDGAGHLAAGQIFWTAEGNLTANINGSFSGGNNGGVGNDVMTWDENNIYIKKNLVFEENSTISWSDSTNPGGSGGGLTKDEVTELATQITKDTITTDELYARNLTVKKLNTGISINEDGTVDDSKLEKNRIEITGNTLNAYDDDNNNTLILSGDNIDTYSSNDGNTNAQFGGPIGYGYSSGNIGTIRLNCDADSIITIPKRTYEVYITNIARNTSFSGVSCTIKLLINGTEYENYTTNALSNNDGSWVADNIWVSNSQSIGNGNYEYICSTSGAHTITWTYEFDYGSISAGSGTNMTMTGQFFNGTLYASSTTRDIKTVVASNGFRTVLSTTEYAEFIKDSSDNTSMKIVSGQNGISINNDKLKIRLNGDWRELKLVNIDNYQVLALS